ncbi:hypothetical protein TNCV_236241 [Trichonephila clavipes]|nr:hypothetical protein TNCV_236241 [Trichonephila clavipes]
MDNAKTVQRAKTKNGKRVRELRENLSRTETIKVRTEERAALEIVGRKVFLFKRETLFHAPGYVRRGSKQTGFNESSIEVLYEYTQIRIDEKLTRKVSPFDFEET